jgi:DNA-binding response OmpR family regulator
MTKGTTPGARRLLIAEKDDLIRALITRWLSEAGYIVTASGGAPGDIALVIADVPDPAQANAVLQEIAARHGAPILVTSGRLRRDPVASKAAARRLGVARVLPKPFTCEELLAAVAKCLDGS